MAPRLVQDAPFLEALVLRADIAAIVLVPPHRKARAMWTFEQTLSATEVARLASLAHDWLSSDPTAPSINATALPGHDEIAVATARTAHGHSATVIACKRAGSRWTGAERDLFALAMDYYADDLVAAAGRPQPRRRPLNGFTPGVEDLRMEQHMRKAAERGELVLLYQPEVELQTGRMLAVEALVRWDHPELGRLGPDSFIALAERSDLIKRLGSWVIAEALREVGSWPTARAQGLIVRINVSPAQLDGDGVVDEIAEALQRNGLAGERLCVEFTENAVTDDIQPLLSTLQSLSRLGIATAIDDLATGYSTLSRLRQLPVDIVKIDRSLISGIDVDDRTRVIVAAVIAMANGLGIAVVAEGVENAAEAATLVELGITRAQGHYFGKAMGAAEIETMLRLGNRLPAG